MLFSRNVNCEKMQNRGKKYIETSYFVYFLQSSSLFVKEIIGKSIASCVQFIQMSLRYNKKGKGKL